MVLWFAGLSWLLVWRVFRSPNVDYRLVVLGAVLPGVDHLIGRSTPLHTVLAAVVGLAVVMVGARGKRLAQRQWLGVPIGLFVHLLLDATWADTDLFWWPVTGAELGSLEIPEADWPVLLVVGMEVVGLLVLAGLWVRLGFTEESRWDRFRRTGHLDRELA